jgi:hypothetical protein
LNSIPVYCSGLCSSKYFSQINLKWQTNGKFWQIGLKKSIHFKFFLSTQRERKQNKCLIRELHLIMFRYCEKTIKFEKISLEALKLLSKNKTRWDFYLKILWPPQNI